jgi:ClpP class serine protease
MRLIHGHMPVLLAPGWESIVANAPAFIARHLSERGEGAVPKRALRYDEFSQTTRFYEVIEGIAVIPVHGILVAKWPYPYSDYVTGYDMLRLKFAQAFADPEVRAIAMDIESPGGEVSGCFDLVDWIFASKSAAAKPIAAILTDYAYSAGYALASVADSIAAPRTGGAGSIGVYMAHVEFAKALEDWGVKVTLIHSGDRKVDGNPFEALPDRVKAEWQAEVDDLRNLFAATVGRNRQAAGAKLDAAAALATEAACYSGPARLAEALALGLIDAVLSPDEAFAQLRQSLG